MFDLSSISGNPLGVTIDDGHGVLSMAVSGDGYLHVSGNMHTTVGMRYVRSTGSISAWTAPGMIGTQETSMTYPMFVRLHSGDLLFFYREGESGDGDIYLNRYNSTAHTWARVGKIIEGSVTDESPYPQHIAVDRTTGDVHLMWTWRDTGPDASTTNDLCYAYSDDDGTTWRNTAGAAYTLPITHATAEKALDTAATGSGLLNSGGMELDADGHPHAAVLQFDGSSHHQIHHVWWDGAAWQNDQVTAWTHSMPLGVALVDLSIARPAIACSSAGKVFIIARNNVDIPDAIVAFDVTPGDTQRQITLIEGPTVAWEPTFDTERLYASDELAMVVHAMRRADETEATNPAFTTLPAWLYSVDLTAL